MQRIRRLTEGGNAEKTESGKKQDFFHAMNIDRTRKRNGFRLD